MLFFKIILGSGKGGIYQLLSKWFNNFFNCCSNVAIVLYFCVVRVAYPHGVRMGDYGFTVVAYLVKGIE